MPRIAVAVSGGGDSTALWHACTSAAAPLGIQVVGLHVHHGLQPQADDWLAHLQRQARRWAARGMPVSLEWRHLNRAPAAGDSIEAWARRHRYAALTEMARSAGIGIVLLAHHRRDQAETFLLQALRGAGPAGLSAMPREVLRNGIRWVRPWLEQPHSAIEAYLRRHRLTFVDDPSNAHTRLARGRLREQVWPALLAGFEHAETTLAASARRAQEAAACLSELAGLDAASVVLSDGALDRNSWEALSPARRANVLRRWLDQAGDHGAAETLVQRLLAELPGATTGRWPFGSTWLQLHHGRLQPVAADAALPDRVISIDLSRPGRIDVPAWRGAFELRRVARGGIEVQRLRTCELRPRSGGERFQRADGAPARSLKKQYQDAGIAQWQRGGPLVHSGGDLLFVPGLGVDARQVAPPGAAQLSLRWMAGAAGGGGDEAAG